MLHALANVLEGEEKFPFPKDRSARLGTCHERAPTRSNGMRGSPCGTDGKWIVEAEICRMHVGGRR